MNYHDAYFDGMKAWPERKTNPYNGAEALAWSEGYYDAIAVYDMRKKREAEAIGLYPHKRSKIYYFLTFLEKCGGELGLIANRIKNEMPKPMIFWIKFWISWLTKRVPILIKRRFNHNWKKHAPIRK